MAFLVGVVVVAHIGRPVINPSFSMLRIARIVHVERRLKRCLHRNRLLVGLKTLRRVFGIPFLVTKEISGVIEHNVLHQVHAAAMQCVRKSLVVFERANVGVYFCKVGRPITVIAPVRAVPPLVGHGRRDPDRCGPQALNVVQSLLHAQQIATAVMGLFLGLVQTDTLVVVARVAVLKPVGHEEVNDLVAPVGRGHMQLQIWSTEGADAHACETCQGKRAECSFTTQRGKDPGHKTSVNGVELLIFLDYF